MKYFKVILSVVFVLAVTFLVARNFWKVEIKVLPKKAAVKTVARKKAPPSFAEVQQKAVVPRAEVARMAIILDDWGYNLSLIKNVKEINRPITLSVLPHLAHSRRLAEEAAEGGLGVMLHMPMQAKNLRAAVEPRTIQTTSSNEEIITYLNQALDSVPGAQGVNNHQGSAATSDERVMKTVLSHLKKKGLFFVDSQVVSTTVGWRLAKEMGMTYTKRDVFIDNQEATDAIKEQLREALKIALSRGRVVVIGHDKKVTIKTIRAMVPELEQKGVKLVLVKDPLE
jgi:polysaccharide deacetylase 2 family uncharacterized protein YibQ